MKHVLKSTGAIASAVGLLFLATTPGSGQSLSSLVCTPAIEQFRIGVIGAPSRELFGQVQDLATAPDGSFYVADLHPQSVRRFDPEGRFIRQIGREGQGPGEYMSLLGIEILSEGELAIWDYGNRRIMTYDTFGAVQRELPVMGGAYAEDAFVAGPHGTYFVKVRTSQPRVSVDGRLLDGPLGYVTISSAGELTDTLQLPEQELAGSFFAETAAGGLRSFPTLEVAALSPMGHLVVGSNEGYSFEIRSTDPPIEVVRRNLQRVPLERSELREWEQVRRHLERTRGVSLDPLPTLKPAFRELRIDEEGRIWVRRHVAAVQRDVSSTRTDRSGRSIPAVTWLEPAVYDIYAADGALLGCVELPWNARVLASRGRRIWGVIRGDFEEEMVARWEM